VTSCRQAEASPARPAPGAQSARRAVSKGRAVSAGRDAGPVRWNLWFAGAVGFEP
jgi:hypothetical protein